MKEKEIIHFALENLEKETGFIAKWKDTAKGDFDGILALDLHGDKMKFQAIIKNELRQYQANEIIAKNYDGVPVIIIAGKIFPKIKEYLRQNEIAYLEANGNFYWKNASRRVLIWLDGFKPMTGNQEKPNRAFTKTGIKTIFHFLLREKLINCTHREIANQVGIGLGNVNYILIGLRELGFLIKLNKFEYKLTDKRQLLDKWITAYKEKLQPDLFTGTYKFLKDEELNDWSTIQFKNRKTCWGGEPAGDLLTNYLRPEEWTLYTLETRQELIKNYRLIPDEKGYVKVYRKFWNTDDANDNIAPPLLVYTDLINKNDKRCTETAELIYDQFIKNNI